MCLSVFLNDESNGDEDSNQKKPLPFTRNRGYPKSASAILKVFQVVGSVISFEST